MQAWPQRMIRHLGRWLLALACAGHVHVWAQTTPADAATAVGPVPCGVVLMHGKWGGANTPLLALLRRQLASVCQVEMPEMPWSGRRLYDEPYEQALLQIQERVASLRRNGARWVAVGGQSFGANAALAYMAQQSDIDAVLAIAPGHDPQYFYTLPDIRSAVDEAQRKVQAGEGTQRMGFTDNNQGQRRSLSVPAQSLWSYFNPQGLGNMGLSASAFKRPVPLLYVIGTRDPLYPSGEMRIYRRAPAHPDSAMVVVPAGHADTPDVASTPILDWVRARTGR